MIEQYFVQPAVLRRFRTGLMVPYLDSLATELPALHYSRKSIRRQLRNADAFGRWLTNRTILLNEVTDAVVNRHVEAMHRSLCPRRARSYRPHNGRGLPRLLELLRRQGVVPLESAPAVIAEPGEQILLAFNQHLERVAGIAPSTRARYLHLIRSFLRAAFGDRDPDCSQLRLEHVTAFVQQCPERWALTSRKDPGTAVRAFLRFLAGQNLVSTGLEYAVPCVRQWQHTALPRFLAREELARVLALPWDRTPKGLRDRAMLLLLARLGLRPREIVRLRLEEIDWRSGNVRIAAGKTRRGRLLPLPHEVGEAVAAYLKEGRPASPHRAVFLNLCPPHQPLDSSVILTKLAREALDRANVCAPRRGAYVFRHTVATHMVCRGVTFKEIADVLGHQSLDTTGIYAKLNLPALAQVALPWPGGAQ